ncbi:MAG TPA: hypothetical protein VGI64_17865 [Streptosporangiaceae bacterium]
MSTDQIGSPADAGADVIELHPRPALPVPVPAPAREPGTRQPVIPPPLHRANLRGTVTRSAALTWHRTRYHGSRTPWYLLLYLFHSCRGAVVLAGRLMRWWHAPQLWQLESIAVAAGRSGHHDAVGVHKLGQQTRGRRGRIVAVCAVLALALVVAASLLLPPWALAGAGLGAVVVLARHGRPEGAKVVGAAVVKPEYQTPTHPIITRALGALGIPAINEVIKDGRALAWVSDVHRDGEGWGTELDLPHGVTPKMILAKCAELASGLRRPLSAVWPEGVPAEHEGRMRLWIGFHDMSKAKPVAWPLARSGQVDVFAGLPFGTDPRGRVVSAPLFEHNWLIGAQPGQGKTAAVRVLACAAALDPLAELWVHEQAGKGDLEPLARVCHRYCSGLDDEAVCYAAASLAMLRRELDTRSRKLKALDKSLRPDGKVTRDMAGRRSARLFPLVAVFDEVQNVFMHPQYGEQAKDDAAYVIRLGRAYGVVLILATQRPTADSMPTSVSGNISVRFCLKVPGQPEVDNILGTSSYKNGYNSAAFRSGTDAGLGWLRAEGDPQVVRTFYLDLPASEKIADRARQLRGHAGTLTGYALGEDTSGEQPRSFAADVLSVFGDAGRLYTSTIAQRLARDLPGVYADITAAAVAAQLRGLGVAIKNVREPSGTPGQGAERAAIEAVTP